MNFPVRTLAWKPAWRVIPSRYPAVGLFERVSGPEDFEALYALEALTNDRVRDEVGAISLVPEEERLFGPGSTCIMAAFTHLNPLGSRFSAGDYGVFYCARTRDTAIAETRYHAARFMTATAEPPMRLPMRLLSVEAQGRVADLRAASRAEPRIVDPDDYGHAQALGRKLRADGALGVLYPSVRDPGGECLGAFRTVLLRHCLHAAYLEYDWNGQAIDAVFELNRVL